jgi:outer membrane protein OmpA-like peptidoglycan-associated protein
MISVHTARRLGGLVVLAAALNACAQKRTVVVLVPDEDGRTGRAAVSNREGTVALTTPRSATVVDDKKAPADVRTMAEAEVAREFGDVLAALPPAPQTFTLYFRFDSDELTAESKVLVNKILEAVKLRSDPEVTVIGHTDTSGNAKANAELGLKRATAVSNLLVKAGLDKSIVEVTSLGETYLLVQTADNTPEQRNRRVEIAIR